MTLCVSAPVSIRELWTLGVRLVEANHCNTTTTPSLFKIEHGCVIQTLYRVEGAENGAFQKKSFVLSKRKKGKKINSFTNSSRREELVVDFVQEGLVFPSFPHN